jgi:hypothetical protein
LDNKDDGQVHHPEKGDNIFATFAAPKGKKKKRGPM